MVTQCISIVKEMCVNKNQYDTWRQKCLSMSFKAEAAVKNVSMKQDISWENG